MRQLDRYAAVQIKRGLAKAKPSPTQQVPIMSHGEKSDAESRVPVSTTWTQCPEPSDDAGFGGSISGVERCRADCSGCPSGAGGCDGGELLGTRQDTGAMRPGRTGPGDGAGGGDDGVRLDGYTPPVTRSPYDPWHSEEYLIGCLVKLHGWYWLRTRVLAGPWRRTRVRSFMQVEGE
jgi:hypothetical protein